MERTAKSFFDDLNKVLHEYLLLEFFKTTDPAITRVKKEDIENFTVENLFMSVGWPKKTQEELEPLVEEVKTFRKYLNDARHKLLAHRDKKTVLGGGVLGVFPEGEDEKFLSALEKIVNICHEACFHSIAGDIIVGMPGDVDDLKKTLKRAVAFKRLFSESKGAEKYKLYNYFKEAGRD